MSGINLGKTPALIVALVIGIIMTTTAILPLVSDYSEAKTLQNDGYFRLDSIKSTDEGTISFKWDHNNPGAININGTDITINYPSVDIISISLMFSDTFTIRFYKEYGGFSCQAYLPYSTFVGASVANGTDLMVTATNGTISVENTASSPATGSATYETLYYPDLNGPWIMKNKDKSAFVSRDSTIIVANGLTNVGDRVVGLYFEGNITDGYDFTVYRSEATTSNVISVYSDVSAYKDIVALEKITFTLTSADNSTDATYSYFLVPYEVTAVPDHPDSYKNLIKIVPLMAFVMLIAAAAAMIINKRD